MIVTVASAAYARLARRCAASLEPFGFDPQIAWLRTGGRRGKDAWVLNTLAKVPQAAHFAFAPERRDNGWFWLIDADTVAVADPRPVMAEASVSTSGVYHVAARPQRVELAWADEADDKRLSAGCVGFAPTPEGMAALAYWTAACRRAIREWGAGRPDWARGFASPEQAFLARAVEYVLGADEETGLPNNLFLLPQSMGGRAEDMRDAKVRPVLFHDAGTLEAPKGPASRTLRREVEEHGG